MTPQEIFDTAVLGVLEQGAPSTHNGRCLYRSPTGTKCAVGMLLDDETAEKADRVNGTASGIVTLVAGYYDIFPEWVIEHVRLLEDLQRAHDVGASDDCDAEAYIKTFAKRARGVGRAYGLSVAAISDWLAERGLSMA